MKQLVIAIFALVVLVAIARSSHACGVPDLGKELAEGLSEAFHHRERPVSAPAIIVGEGGELELRSVSLGWAWGTYQDDWLFSGATVQRVLLTGRSVDHQPRLALTYGWYETTFGTAGLDLGVDAGRDGAGPLAQLTLGVAGIGVQLSGDAHVAGTARYDGTAELVVDVSNLMGLLQ